MESFTFLNSGAGWSFGSTALRNIAIFRQSDLSRAVIMEGVQGRSNNTAQNSSIHDKTLKWDPSVNRVWLNLKSGEASPPAMLLLTSYRWNQENQTYARENFARRIRETELMQGVINHPWFHPTAWTDFETHFIKGGNRNTNGTKGSSFPLLQYLIKHTKTRFYIFLDVNTYDEVHYPTYHAHNANLDTTGGRVGEIRGRVLMDMIHSFPVWKSSLLQAVPHHRIKVVVFDGTGWGPYPGNRNPNLTIGQGVHTWHLPLAMVAIAALLSHVNHTIDQGLIPPTIKRANLTDQQIDDIRTCDAEHTRPFLVTYTGNLRSGLNPKRQFQARGMFHEAGHNVDDGKTILIRRNFLPEYQSSVLANLTYEEVLMSSVYSLTPRGDNKYSYKFSEVLAAGSIPVVLADDWMYPFRPELVDWKECAVILPEKYAGHPTIAVLKYISIEQRCRMRQRCYEIYKQFIERPEGTVDGIVQGLELVANGHRKAMNGVKCMLGEGVWKDGYWIRENVSSVLEPDIEHCNLQ